MGSDLLILNLDVVDVPSKMLLLAVNRVKKLQELCQYIRTYKLLTSGYVHLTSETLDELLRVAALAVAVAKRELTI
jgi:hypothetical protein